MGFIPLWPSNADMPHPLGRLAASPPNNDEWTEAILRKQAEANGHFKYLNKINEVCNQCNVIALYTPDIADMYIGKTIQIYDILQNNTITLCDKNLYARTVA